MDRADGDRRAARMAASHAGPFLASSASSYRRGDADTVSASTEPSAPTPPPSKREAAEMSSSDSQRRARMRQPSPTAATRRAKRMIDAPATR